MAEAKKDKAKHKPVKVGDRYVCPHCKAQVPVRQDCPECKLEIDWSKI